MPNNIEWKYIMVDGAFPVIFFASFPHKAFADRFEGTISSAGFIRIKGRQNQVEVETYGESDGLKLKPAPEDARVIQFFLNKSFQEVKG